MVSRFIFPAGINECLLSDLAKKLGTTNLLNWIEEKAELLASFGDTGIWIELTPLLMHHAGADGCQYSNTVIGTSQLSISHDGVTVVEHHNYCEPEDRRFWIAHELGHILWRTLEDSKAPLSNVERQIGSDLTIEWLCNRFAAALLTPRFVLRRAFESIGNGAFPIDYNIDLSFIPDLARKLRVPERLLARRIYHEVSGNTLSIFRVDRENSTVKTDLAYKIRWEAMPRFLITKTKRLVGRNIPRGMLPLSNITESKLDGRWLPLIKSAFQASRARPLKDLGASLPPTRGTARWLGQETDRNSLLIGIETPYESVFKSRKE